MLSLTAEYALRAMIYLAQHSDECPIPGRRIAAESQIPPNYLATVLGDLVRAGVLQGSPGRGGGFSLARRSRDIRLNEVLASFEPILANRRPCPFGKEVCSDEDPCAAHQQWKRVRETYARFLERNTVYDVSFLRRTRQKTGSRKRTKR